MLNPLATSLFFPHGYPQEFFLTVLVAFASALQRLELIAKREPHLRKWPYQVGLCINLWCIFLMVHVGRPSSLCSATPGLVVRGSIRNPGEQAVNSKPKLAFERSSLIAWWPRQGHICWNTDFCPSFRDKSVSRKSHLLCGLCST